METSIDGDLPCAICGYNLKGLGVEGNCPECGQSVGRTYSAELSRSDPGWLRGQANTMLLLGALCLVNFYPRSYSFGGFQMWMGLGILASLATVWACWRLGTAEPPGPPADGEATLQRALRLAPIIYAAVRISALVRESFGNYVAGFLGISALVCLLVTNALVGWFMLRLARRSNDRSLILHARIVAWAFPLTQAIDLLLFFAGSFLPEGFRTNLIFTNGMSVINWLLGAVVYVTVMLMGRMHETLRSAAKVSEGRVAVG